jgi:hypothetical protein
MATTPAIPVPIKAAIHGPYEDAIIAGFTLMGKLIDGQTPEQKAQIWQGWIDFWKPLNSWVSKIGV